MKICTYCKETKELNNFAISSSFDMPVRISSRCKNCLNKIAREKRVLKPKRIGYKTEIKNMIKQLSENELKELYQIIKMRYAL